MLTIINDNTDPRYNLALEEYVLKNIDVGRDFILLWQNEPSVIIGRNQNTIEEINQPFIEERNIHVVRRISGGGAVYHDFGNLNFTFVTAGSRENLNNFVKFTKPVIDALESLGVKAEFAGRNDILVSGKKISGNAQTFYKNKMFHHGTILFDADLAVVAEALNVSGEKITSKSVKSVRSRVTNILPYLDTKIDIKEFQDILLKYILNTNDVSEYIYELTDDEIAAIKELKANKYDTWQWNYGESPDYSIEKTARHKGGTVSFKLDISEGKIKRLKIFGDFFGRADVSELADLLIGINFTYDEVKSVLLNINITDYFFNISMDDILNQLFL